MNYQSIKISNYEIRIFESADALYTTAAEYIVTVANAAVAERGRFTISLSGGETPKGLYSVLSKSPFREKIRWEKTFVFWGDERCVPLDDARNNAYEAKSIWLDKINIPPSNIYRIPVNLPPMDAASNYEKSIKTFFGGEVPRFDLMLLGLGDNGHTASLFPGTKVITEQAAGIREVYVEKGKMFRITMTAPLINKAKHIVFLVTGEKKAGILNEVLTASYQPDKYPAQLIKPVNGELVWFVDTAAASLLNV